VTEKSIFINGAVDVRIDKNMLNFMLGEWVRRGDDNSEFIVAENFVIEIEEARGLFAFLLSKLPQEPPHADKTNSSDEEYTLEPEDKAAYQDQKAIRKIASSTDSIT
jgi:hypothetical protein